MNPLVEQNDRFRRAADVEAEIPITAGPPIVRKWWVKRADYLAAPPRKLDDIIREVYGMELIRFSETGDAMPSVPERQRYEYDTKTAAIAAALIRSSAIVARPIAVLPTRMGPSQWKCSCHASERGLNSGTRASVSGSKAVASVPFAPLHWAHATQVLPFDVRPRCLRARM